MSPKPKSVPPRLVPPPQLSQLHASRYGRGGAAHKFEPKMREVLGRQAKLIARWLHVNLTWKKILMTWMVLLVASKMVLLMLTYKFFTLTSLISLQIFHGVWTIAFFCLTVIDARAILPNASCLLAGYLPATTVLHILLIPNDYPLEYIIVDAVGTFLAIINMFLLLRMECTEILHEAEELWERQGGASDTTSESGLSSSGCSVASGSDCGRRGVIGRDLPPLHAPIAHLGPPPTLSGQVAAQHGRRIIGNPTGPTIITVNGVNAVATARAAQVAAAQYDSLLFSSIEEPEEGVRHSSSNVDLEPIDFEHFVDEPDMGNSERMFRVAFGESPPLRGR